MIKPIVKDEMFLSQPSAEATMKDLKLAVDLTDTLRAHASECVGMAANMIGVKKNVIVVSMGFMQMAMVNAKITSRKKPYQTEEGCLSFMGGPVKTTRYDEIEVEYQDASFKPKKDKFTGFTAQIIQHELDHVNGVLI